MTAPAAGAAAAPFREHRTVVRPEWVDYNEHMNDAAYAVVLTAANEEFLAALGLSADYRTRTGSALFTAESHLRYLAECSLGQQLSAATLLVAADAKRVHLHTELLDEAGAPVATGEYLYLHVDTVSGRVAELPPDRQQHVAEVLAVHATLPRPTHLGRGVGQR